MRLVHTRSCVWWLLTATQLSIEFTPDEIRDVWRIVFKATPPEHMSVKQIYDACLMQLGPEILRKALNEKGTTYE